ncbi:MAG: DUF4124 domain-containing protein [Burkholderiaceae bacterium]|nr:DUF4124 domain-containing protein [Burkholderiaceae bacterium]
MHRYLWLFLAVSIAPAVASPVNKCVDVNGKVTFSQYGCSEGAASESVTISQPPRPSGDGPAVKMAVPSTEPPRPRVKRTFNHCGDLTQVDIAYARGRGEIILGMTADDVRRIWGPPAQVNASASGQQWVYPIDEYRNRYLYVDNSGCFTYWN